MLATAHLIQLDINRLLKKLVLFLFVLLVEGGGILNAVAGPMVLTESFSGRSCALSGISAVESKSASNLLKNPAAISFIDSQSVEFSWRKTNSFYLSPNPKNSQDFDIKIAAYALPTSVGTFAFAGVVTHDSPIFLKNSSSHLISTMTSQDTIYACSWATPEMSGVSLGFSLKGIYSSLDNTEVESSIRTNKDFAFAGDFGVNFQGNWRREKGVGLILSGGESLSAKNPFDTRTLPFNLYAGIRNLGTMMEFSSSTKLDLPFSYYIGSQTKFSGRQVSLGIFAEGEFPNEGENFARIAGEISFRNIFFLRGGWQSSGYIFSPTISFNQNYSAGCGLRLGLIELDYGVRLVKDSVATHQGTLAVKFGKQRAKKSENSAKEMSKVSTTSSIKKKEIETTFQWGLRAYQEDNYSVAKSAFEKVVQMDPEHEQAKFYIASIERYSQGVASILYQQGMVLAKEENYTEALAHFKQALKIYPKHSEASKQVKFVEKKLKEISLNSQQIQQPPPKEVSHIPPPPAVSDTNSSNALSLYSQARSLYEQNRLVDSLSLLLRAKKLDPKLKEANSLIEKTREQLANIYFRQGTVFYIQGNYEKSLDEFSRALEYKPDFADAQLQIQKIRREIDERNAQKAKDVYNRGLVAYANGELETAVRLWEESLTLDPYNPSIQKTLDRGRAELRERKIP